MRLLKRDIFDASTGWYANYAQSEVGAKLRRKERVRMQRDREIFVYETFNTLRQMHEYYVPKFSPYVSLLNINVANKAIRISQARRNVQIGN